VGVHVTGVDQFQGPGLQVDAPEQGGDELVRGRMLSDVLAGLLGLLGQGEATPTAVAQAADAECGQLRSRDAVSHRIGD
jgi:hypothetical protein